MKTDRIARLKSKGYKITDTKDFLGLADEEMALIDLKLALIVKLKQSRLARKLTQQQLAVLIGSSQSRVAMLERGRPDVSLDLICRALFALGVSRKQLAKAVAPASAAGKAARPAAVRAA
jgi:DNA-binding XRE family transcriptional regulator